MLKTLAAALIATAMIAGPVLAAQGTTGQAPATASAPKVHKKHHVRHHMHHAKKHHVKKHYGKKHHVKHKHHHMAKAPKAKADK
jgi:Ni/Co efflux regulator RcnB